MSDFVFVVDEQLPGEILYNCGHIKTEAKRFGVEKFASYVTLPKQSQEKRSNPGSPLQKPEMQYQLLISPVRRADYAINTPCDLLMIDFFQNNT